MPLSSENFYFMVNDAVNRCVLIEMNNQLTDEQRKVLDAMHALLWNYVNTTSE